MTIEFLRHFNIVFVVQLLSCVQPLVTPWTAGHQASLSFTISWSLLKLMSIESVMPYNHLVFCCPLLLLPSVFPRIRVFSALRLLDVDYYRICSMFPISLEAERLPIFQVLSQVNWRLDQCQLLSPLCGSMDHIISSLLATCSLGM